MPASAFGINRPVDPNLPLRQLSRMAPGRRLRDIRTV